MELKIKKTLPITKQLSKKYGGTWIHIPFHSIWICDELNLSACYVADGGYDMNGNYQPVHKAFRRLTVYGLKTGVEYLYPR